MVDVFDAVADSVDGVEHCAAVDVGVVGGEER